MLSKKKSIFGLFIIFLFSTYAQENISISKIKIIIQDAEYVWEKDSPIVLETESSSHISPYTVTSYTSLVPGKVYTLEQLNEEILRTQLRLIDSGLFYSAVVQIIPPRKNPQERTIIITVTEGFFHRFSGGNAYGMYGREGLAGNRSGIYGFVGWNLLQLRYYHENLFNDAFILSTSFASHDLFPSLVLNSDYEHSMDFSVQLGKYLNPDIALTLSQGIVLSTEPLSFSEAFVYIGPVLSVKRYELKPFSFSWNMETSGLWYINQKSYKTETCWALHKNFAENIFKEKGRCQKLTLALSLNGGYENSIDSEGLAFNLYNDADRNIRSGYTKDELQAHSYALFSAELRFDLFVLKISPVFYCDSQIFMYTDSAFIERKNVIGRYSYVDALGGGFRFLFDNPIFANFTFTLGVNHEGKSRFGFSATAGY